MNKQPTNEIRSLVHVNTSVFSETLRSRLHNSPQALVTVQTQEGRANFAPIKDDDLQSQSNIWCFFFHSQATNTLT